MKILLIPCLALSLAAVSFGEEKDGWFALFDGKSLDGWKAAANQFAIQFGSRFFSSAAN